VVQEVARELAGKGVVVQVNTQENPGLASRFSIRGIPTVLLLRGAKVIDSIDGAVGKEALLSWWKRHLS
jgi:thioredoxin 1